jgi:hypothetical protein
MNLCCELIYNLPYKFKILENFISALECNGAYKVRYYTEGQ